jgi:hypothetical protein
VPPGKGLEQNLVLAEEAGKSRYAGDGNRRHHERGERDRQVLPQSTHVADVLFTVQRVNDGTGSQEQTGLEERVRIEMEDAGAERADAHRQEHQAELRHGGVREHALDVVLHEPDGRGHQGRRGADDGDNHHRLRRVAEEHGIAPDHVDPRGDHRRRMDQRRHRRRAFHRVRQPGVQRNLR